MVKLTDFWDIGPHDPLPVEETWTDFVTRAGGQRVSDILSKSPGFKNADYMFEEMAVVLELKEIKTEFLRGRSKIKKLKERIKNSDKEEFYLVEDSSKEIRDCSRAYQDRLLRHARPSIIQILKKANRQIRETKRHFHFDQPRGTLILVNDDFTDIAIDLVVSLVGNILAHDYSSIDCCVYMTVNRYIEITGSNEPQLIWNSSYSERADDDLVSFIDDLGDKWFSFMEEKIGLFTSKTKVKAEDEISKGQSIFFNSKSVILPGENRDLASRG